MYSSIKKDQRTKSAFSALHRFAAFIQIQPNGCDSSLQHWEMLLFMLQVTRGVAHTAHLCALTLPATASKGGQHILKRCPGVRI